MEVEVEVKPQSKAGTMELVRRRNEQILAMKRSGQTTTRIAHYYGLSLQRVSEILHEFEFQRVTKSVYTPNRRTPRPAEYPCGIEIGELRFKADTEETCAGQGCHHRHCPALLAYNHKFNINPLTRRGVPAYGHAHGGGKQKNG